MCARSAALPFVALVIWRLRPAWPVPRLGAGIALVGCIDLLATSLIAIANTKGDLFAGNRADKIGGGWRTPVLIVGLLLLLGGIIGPVYNFFVHGPSF